MADKTVNVNIKYNVDTSLIQKAEAASRAAQGATDKLRKSVDEYGKASAQANKVTQDSLKKTSTDVSTLTKDFGSLYTAVKAVLTAGIVREFVDLTLNMAKLSGQVQGVTVAFNRLPNATLLLNDLRKATHGTVTDLNLMQKALSAQNFRIPLEQLGKLLEFAAAKAQQTGQEVNHLVDYIVSGIGYRSIKRLDDLGFTANRVKEALGGVSLQAADMGQVMTAVTTLMNEDLKKTGGYATTTATQVEQIEVQTNKLKVALSEFGTSSGLLNFYQGLLENLTRGVNFFIGGQEKIRKEAAKTQAINEVNNFKERALTKEILQDKQKILDAVQQEANTNQQIIGRNNDELKTLKERLSLINKLSIGEATRNQLYGDRFSLEGKTWNEQRLINKEFAETLKNEEEEIKKQITYYTNRNEVLGQTIKVLGEYRDSVKLNNESDEESIGLIEKKRKEIEALQESIEKTQKAGDLGSKGTLTTALKKAQEELDVLLGKDKEKRKKTANEVQEYLAYLSDLDLHQTEEHLKAKKEQREADAKHEKEAAKNTREHLKEVYEKRKEDAEELAKREKELREEVSESIFNNAQALIGSLLQGEVDGYSQRLYNLRNFYDEQMLLAGDNKRAKDQLKLQEERETQTLEKRRADREKKAAQAGILVNTALAIIKIFAGEGTYVDKLIRAGIMAGEGATQYTIASRARYYAKGEINIKGPGNESSDSIPAMLSKGESIMTAKQTREAFGILTDVRAGKLNDRVLKQLVTNGGSQMVMDDSRIVEAIKGQPKPPDLVRNGRQIYEVYTDQQNNKRFIRSKSI